MNDTASDSLNLRDMATRLWSGRRWIITSVALFTIAFGVVALVMTPAYRAAAVLVPADADRNLLSGSLASTLGQFGGLASIAGINLGDSGSGKEEALAVLKSREFTEHFINDQQLMPILFAKRWDSEAGRWRGKASSHPTPGQAYKRFDDIRTVSQDKRTGLVTVSIEWKDREQAAAWANGLVARLNAEMRARAIATADASLNYLERELERTSVVSTREAINRLIEAQIRKRMLANVNREFAFRVVDRAIAPDADDRVRPKRLLMVVAGLGVGLVLGAFAVLAFAPRRELRPLTV